MSTHGAVVGVCEHGSLRASGSRERRHGESSRREAHDERFLGGCLDVGREEGVAMSQDNACSVDNCSLNR